LGVRYLKALYRTNTYIKLTNINSTVI